MTRKQLFNFIVENDARSLKPLKIPFNDQKAVTLSQTLLCIKSKTSNISHVVCVDATHSGPELDQSFQPSQT